MEQVNFPKMEEQILSRWKAENTFEKSLKIRKRAKRFVFYEGPPTANAGPGLHHVLARVFKDVICRYKTMRGFLVERKGGWDTHGLPVELQIEKKLGIKSKKDIEKYGIAKFNAECKKSVWEFKKEWEDLTERIGFWLDLKHPYITYEKSYMETLWWIIKQFWQKGLLCKDYKIVPYCPRCGTPLSSHEMAQGYKTVKDRSVYVKFKVKGVLPGSEQGDYWKNADAYFLAWTTTPWTLPGNVALAIGEDIKYQYVKRGDEIYVVAQSLIKHIFGNEEAKNGYRNIGGVHGEKLTGFEYEPLFDSLKNQPEKKHYVVLGDFVSTEEGTGIVHTAVMYGEDDYRLGQKLNLPKKHTVDEEGKFNELVPQWKGVFVKDAEPLIIEDLKKRNLLFKEELCKHEYPFCWRCSTPLLYYAKESWFVNTQKVKGKLISNNQSINWIPSHIKTGRMGEWLQEVKDWAFSRERYWGTPLPVWECDSCEHQEGIGCLDDLRKQKYSQNTYYILRHGHSQRQVTNENASWPETKRIPLTRRGEVQIKKVAQQLKKKGIGIIISSDLLRAKQTAEIIGKEVGIKPVYDKRLREFDTGIFNGKSVEEMTTAVWRKEGETPIEHFLRRFEQRVPQGENYVDVQKRVFSLMNDLERKHQAKRILLVGHELPLTLLEGLMRGYSREKVMQFRIKKAIDTGEFRALPYARFPYSDDMEVDLHRPFIDAVEFTCVKCNGGTMKRVKEVVDVWFDSGSMPFASGVKGYPADYICEAIDQTRGWFYTLLAVATALGLKAPYKNVISLGHLLDEKGEKMSKSKGNVVNPWDMIEKYGVDTLRWYFYTLNQPWDAKLFAEKDLQQTMRKFILTLWNSFVFYQTYKKSQTSGLNAQAKLTMSKLKTKHILDIWIASRLHSVIKETTKKLDDYDITGAARLLENFVVDDLSLWYIRRSRQRFQNPVNGKKLQEASSVLRFVLLETSKLAAPFIPFLSEHIYGELGGKGSVHWQNWPHFAKATRGKPLIDEKLEKEMVQVRKLVAKGLAERAKAGIKVRQPLASLKFSMSNAQFSNELTELAKHELNVKELVFDKSIKAEVELDTVITPELRREGLLREILRNIQDMRKKSGYKPKDRVRLSYTGAEELKALLRENEKAIMLQAGLKEMKEKEDSKQPFDFEQEFSLDNKPLWLGIKK